MKIYISTNVDKLIDQSSIINFSVNSLLRVISLSIIVIENEKNFVNKLLYYYNYNESNGSCIYCIYISIVSLDFKKKFKEISNCVKWELLQIDSLISSSFLHIVNLHHQDVCNKQHLNICKNDFTKMIIRCYYTNCYDELENYIERNEVIYTDYSKYCKYSELDGLLSKICIFIIIIIISI